MQTRRLSQTRPHTAVTRNLNCLGAEMVGSACCAKRAHAFRTAVTMNTTAVLGLLEPAERHRG